MRISLPVPLPHPSVLCFDQSLALPLVLWCKKCTLLSGWYRAASINDAGAEDFQRTSYKLQLVICLGGWE